MRVIAVRVEWDGKAPTVVYVPASIVEDAITYDTDEVLEYLSDQHGYLVKSWEVASDC